MCEIRYDPLMRKISTLIGIYLLLSVLAGLAFLVLSFPNLPATPRQWALLFLLALPATIVFETIGSWIGSNSLARRIDSHTRDKSLSVLRIVYGVLMAVTGVVLALAAAWAWQGFRSVLGW